MKFFFVLIAGCYGLVLDIPHHSAKHPVNSRQRHIGVAPVNSSNWGASVSEEKAGSSRLKVKSGFNQTLTVCPLVAGLVSPQLTSTCCLAVQIVAQRALVAYGLADKCNRSWKCASDGATPKVQFEEDARSTMCAEPHCMELVGKALLKNWVTKKGVAFFDKACDKSISVAQATDNMQAGLSGETGALRRRRRASRRRDGKTSVGCFPGHAIVEIGGRGPSAISTVEIGDEVLVENSLGRFSYEPVIGSLHQLYDTSDFLQIEHEHGVFRASANHIVFVSSDTGRVDKNVGSLLVGDFLFVSAKMKPWPIQSRVLAVSLRSGFGMFAPLTASGKLVVDGVVASVYASPSELVRLPHSLAHAAFFPVRMFYWSGLQTFVLHISKYWPFSSNKLQQHNVDLLHPYVSLLYNLKAETVLNAFQ